MGAAIAGLTFILMLFAGVDFIAALVGSIILLTLFSGVSWVHEQAEDNTESFGKWYAIVIWATFIIIAIVYFTQ